MAAQILRYFDLSKAVDPDPSLDQPGEVATTQDGTTPPLALIPIIESKAPPVFSVVLLDAAGKPADGSAGLLTLRVVTRRPQTYQPPGAAGPRPAVVWNAGPRLDSYVPGEYATQTQLPEGSAVGLIITSVAGLGASGFLAVEVLP